MTAAVYIEVSATVSADAVIGAGTKIWHQAQVADRVTIGQRCVLGKGVYLGSGTVLGDRVKVQNGCGVFGAQIGDDVQLSPGVYLLEDPAPRASLPNGIPKRPADWRRMPVTVHAGATLGANTTVAPGVVIGRWAMAAIGSVISRDVPEHAIVAGNPARHVGWVCACGMRLDGNLSCIVCSRCYEVGEPGLYALDRGPELIPQQQEER